MARAVLTSKDFWSGLLFMGMGAAALILGNDLRVGTMARMGPGFVPHAIGWILIALGAVIAVKGFACDAERVVRLHLRPVGLIVLSVVVFALLLQPVGLVPAMAAMIAISAPAAGQVRVWETVGIAAFLIVLCVLVFKVMLEMSFPVIAGVW
ncbi:MAG: tripartite tricarboxylate transporter TctB family protein [Rhizobiales bacterium]|nr:tripartite tricarboxylate transporter TctB family protein [Hyphomicrobiales bacterium]